MVSQGHSSLESLVESCCFVFQHNDGLEERGNR